VSSNVLFLVLSLFSKDGNPVLHRRLNLHDKNTSYFKRGAYQKIMVESDSEAYFITKAMNNICGDIVK
ncbi:TPA: hypothetical protein ACHK05_004794, partial [Escherichia coli]